MRDYRELTGLTVKLLEMQRVVAWVDGKFQVTGEIPAGTIGTASNRSNAGFRGLEWTFTAPDGRRTHGVSGALLKII